MRPARRANAIPGGICEPTQTVLVAGRAIRWQNRGHGQRDMIEEPTPFVCKGNETSLTAPDLSLPQ
jgi:hypothetical protein